MKDGSNGCLAAKQKLLVNVLQLYGVNFSVKIVDKNVS